MSDTDGPIDAARTEKARGLLGRTIADAVVRGHSEHCDAINVLVLTMTDGSRWEVLGSYGGYTGNSCDEYPEFIGVYRVDGTA